MCRRACVGGRARRTFGSGGIAGAAASGAGGTTEFLLWNSSKYHSSRPHSVCGSPASMARSTHRSYNCAKRHSGQVSYLEREWDQIIGALNPTTSSTYRSCSYACR